MSKLDSITIIDDAMYIAVDVGKTGAIVAAHRVKGDSDLNIRVYSMDDYQDFLNWFSGLSYPEDFHIFIEKQQASPKQGVSSAFQTGYGFGRVQGWFEAFFDLSDITFVQPKTWMAHLGIKGGMERKDRKVEIEKLVKEIFPRVSTRGPRGGLMDGVSDALGILYYGMSYAT